MAMARPQAASGGSGGMKAGLIVFACVSVLSLGGLIFLFTKQEKVRNDAEQAERQAAAAGTQQRALQEELRQFADRILADTDVSDAAEILQAIETQMGAVADDPRLESAGIDRTTAVINALQQLHTLFSQQADELESTQAAMKELQDDFDILIASGKDRDEAFKQKADQLLADYQKLEQQSATDRQNWQQQLASLEQTLTERTDRANAELAQERQLRGQLDEALEKEQARNRALLGELASFKPQPDLYSVLQVADGSVVRALAGEDIVYIDLGREDGVSRGMSFAIYPRTHGIPANGKGKAAIEVVNIYERTSECRVTQGSPDEPIIRDDLVANPVYDRSRQYRFALVGDFDLDFNGTIDDLGGEKVAAMIRGWGGKLVATINTSTDFVVAGETPAAEIQLPPGTEEDVANERRAEHEAERKSFDTAIQEAKALSIPILTRTQFLHFVGQHVPDNAPDDALPPL